MTRAKNSKPSSNQRPARNAAPASKRVAKTTSPATAAKSKAPREPGKIEQIITLLRRPKGATIADLTKATDWQAHSVRGAISGAIKKKQGLVVVSEKTGDVRTYRIAG